MKITTYESSNLDRIRLSAWKLMFGELWDSRELIRRLVVRNVASQFRQSFLGYIWIVLPPIATTFIFTMLQRAKIVNIEMPADGMPYAIFALLGTTFWQFFAQVVSMATNSISSAGALVSKIYFPREVLVLSAVGNSIVNLAIRMVVILLTFVLLAYAPHVNALFCVALLIPMLMLGVGIGLYLAPLNTMMNDVTRMIEFAFQFGLFLVPTVYPTPVLSSDSSTWQIGLYWIHQLNPIAHYLNALRDLFQTGTFNVTAGLQISVMLSVLLFFSGWRFFHATEPLLAERVNA